MGAAAAIGGGGAGPLLAMGGFAVVGLVAVLPCLLLLAVIALPLASRRVRVGGALPSTQGTMH